MIGQRGPVLGLILKGYPRISETFISNEILLLEACGIPVHIFSMRQPRENFTHRSVQNIRARVDYLPETLLAPLPRFLFYNVRLALRIPNRYLLALKMAWRRWQRTRRAATLKHLLQAGYLVERLLPGKGVAHLHAHFAHSPTSVALFSSILSRQPFSFTAHAKDIYTSDPRQLREKIGLARFVVTCTEYNRSYLTKLAAGGRSPIHCVYHGIDTQLFNGASDLCDSKPPYQILTVSRLTAKKGLPTVYRALQRLRQEGLDFRHTLIGDGEERDRLLALVRHLGLEKVTYWLGTQPHHVVMDHYRRADLFVLGCEVAANGDRDGIPNVLLESMAMGVPVVATDVSAISELVTTESTGLLVPPGRDETLAQAMRRVLTDQALRRQFIPLARQRVLQDFDNRRLVGALVALMQDALDNSPVRVSFQNLIT